MVLIYIPLVATNAEHFKTLISHFLFLFFPEIFVFIALAHLFIGSLMYVCLTFTIIKYFRY